jgi:hypothetical protein
MPSLCHDCTMFRRKQTRGAEKSSAIIVTSQTRVYDTQGITEESKWPTEQATNFRMRGIFLNVGFYIVFQDVPYLWQILKLIIIFSKARYWSLSLASIIQSHSYSFFQDPTKYLALRLISYHVRFYSGIFLVHPHIGWLPPVGCS